MRKITYYFRNTKNIVQKQQLGANDSKGAVEEMRRVKESGWLKYTTMAIRPVPDCYDVNSENGWWDDEHWQMYGGGERQKDDSLHSAHYCPPYETTKKWAQAVYKNIETRFNRVSMNNRRPQIDIVEMFPMLVGSLFFDIVKNLSDTRRRRF